MCADECDVRFSVGGQDIELVDNWPHLCHVISKDGDSKSECQILHKGGVSSLAR